MRFEFKGSATDLETLQNTLNSDPQMREQFEANPAVFLGQHGIEVDQETANALTSNIGVGNGDRKAKAPAAFFIPHVDVIPHVDIG